MPLIVSYDCSMNIGVSPVGVNPTRAELVKPVNEALVLLAAWLVTTGMSTSN
ncbi:MAG: hypothetical protein RLZZ535_1298 [Cyanobacteriota bacterium]|jgi:hypothetical protein